MRRVPWIAAATPLLVATMLPVAAGRTADLVETRALDESVPAESVERVVVENVFGSVRVTTHDRATVEMRATETIRAETPEDLERARREVGLVTEREDDRVSFRVRRQRDERCDCDCDCRWVSWDGFVIEYDIEVRVPADVSIDASTVNGGEVVVNGVLGEFDVSNVNGPVVLGGLRGAGRASTVNGRLDASFDRSPAGATSFETVNGRIEVAFPADLSADLEFKTMHGEVWTDFPARPLALDPVRETTRHGDRLVIRAERRSGVRVAAGGPTHSFETLNGDIYVRETHR